MIDDVRVTQAIRLSRSADDRAVQALSEAQTAREQSGDAYDVARGNRAHLREHDDQLGQVATELSAIRAQLADIQDTQKTILELIQRNLNDRPSDADPDRTQTSLPDGAARAAG